MSRWIDEFQNHSFHQEWEKVTALIREIVPADPADVNQVQEISRLFKVSQYIDALIKSLDPELLHPGFLDPLASQAQGCSSNIEAYKSNSDISHIRNANNHSDEILKHLRANIPASNVKAYTQALDGQSQIIRDISQKLKDEVIETVKSVRAENTRLGTSKKCGDAIESYYAELFEGAENVKPIKQKIGDLSSSANDVYNSIKSYEQELLTGKDGGKSIKMLIDDQKAHIDDLAKGVNETNNLVSKTVQDLRNFHLTFFGGKAQDGQDIKGLETEIEEKISVLDSLAKEHKDKHAIILAEINSLIGKGTSAGLAGAFTQKRKRFTEEKYIFTGVFIFSIIGIGVYGSGAYAELSDLINQWLSVKPSEQISDVPVDTKYQLISNLLHKLAWLVPLVWLALFSGSRRSEATRLEQEYAHKEAISLSYESFKRQAKELEADETVLQKKLLDAAITTVAHNPAQSLDKKHDEPFPMGKLVEPVSDLISKVIEKIK
jgi:tetrahydromethanopterin S-methyltransferase subunit B